MVNELIKQDPKQMVSKDVAIARIKNVMKNHIGSQNPITRVKLFSLVFGNVERYSPLQIYYLWSKLKLYMNWLRRYSNCFIVMRRTGNTYEYFVVTNRTEAGYYTEIMDSTIRRCQFMKQRCLNSADKQLYKTFLKENSRFLSGKRGIN